MGKFRALAISFLFWVKLVLNFVFLFSGRGIAFLSWVNIVFDTLNTFIWLSLFVYRANLERF